MKNIKLILTTIFIVIITIILSSSVYAGTVTSIEATEESGKITVSGTVDSSVYAVAIVVYSGSNLEYMETASVNADGTYSVELGTTFADGTYTVKVADYAGGEYVSKEVKSIEYIDEINLTVEAPEVGTEIKMVETTDEYGTYTTQQNKPVVKPEDGAKYTVWMPTWILGTSTSTDIPDGKNWYEAFEGTVEADKYYYAVLSVSTDSGYKFKDGLTIKVNGEKPEELFGIYNNTSTDFIAKIKAVEKTEEAAEEEDNTLDSTPKTGDNITIFFVIFAVAAVGAIAVITLNRKTAKSKKSSKH